MKDDKIVNKIKKVLKKFKVKKAGIFGSFARGEESADSDIDILIEVKGSLMDVVKIEMSLEKEVKRKIDLLTYGGISPLLKDRILKEEIRII